MIVGSSRRLPERSKLALWFGGVIVLALAVGLLAGLLPGAPPAAHAVDCQPANDTCGPNDGTKTSSLEVSHHTSPSYIGTSTYVEPDDGERWKITAYWRQATGTPCGEINAEAYATVSWNGSSWVLSNVSGTGGNIVDIDICQGATCDAGGGSTQSWEYMLIVDLTDPVNPLAYNLDRVVYATTEVDDGYTIENATHAATDCGLDSSVSPTSQSFGATDQPGKWGSSRCAYNCNAPIGASVTLYYD